MNKKSLDWECSAFFNASSTSFCRQQISLLMNFSKALSILFSNSAFHLSKMFFLKNQYRCFSSLFTSKHIYKLLLIFHKHRYILEKSRNFPFSNIISIYIKRSWITIFEKKGNKNKNKLKTNTKKIVDHKNKLCYDLFNKKGFTVVKHSYPNDHKNSQKYEVET